MILQIIIPIITFFIGFIFGNKETEKKEDKERIKQLKTHKSYNI